MFFDLIITTLFQAKKSGGVAKKTKDPNAPKRAMSAFFFWMQENREKLKKPGMGVADVAKAAGVEWGKLVDKSVRLPLLFNRTF